MGLTKPSVFMMVALGCLAACLLLQIIGLATTGWMHFLNSDYGLWKLCGNNACVDIGSGNSTYDTCRAFGVLAVLLLGATGVVAVLSLLMDNSILLILPIAGSAAGAFCILIEFAVFAGKFGSDVSYGYSFALTIVAWILAGVSTGFFFLNKARK